MDQETARHRGLIEGAQITQASVMDNTSVLLVFSNGSSALVDSVKLKNFVLHSGAKIIHGNEVGD